MPWTQNYDPLGNPWISTLVAAIPVVSLLGMIASGKVRIHYAATIALAIGIAIAIFAYGMPAPMAFAAAGWGAATGLLPIGWIVINVIFLYTLTVQKGLFDKLKEQLVGITPDPRLQVLLIAFCFGAFFEGAAGFGTPVAVCASILIGLGFKPLNAAVLCLIANTAPVAFGGLGIPIEMLSRVTGLDIYQLSAMVGRQLPFFSLLIPFWVVWAQVGWKKMMEVWPGALTAGASFAIPQFLISNYHGPWLVDIASSIISILSLVVLLKFWRPKDSAAPAPNPAAGQRFSFGPWVPWLILSVMVFAWGIPLMQKGPQGDSPAAVSIRAFMKPEVPVPALHNQVYKSPPLAPAGSPPEKAVYEFKWLSSTGTAIFLAAILAGLIMRFRPGELARVYGQTMKKVWHSIWTIMAMIGLGFVTKSSGVDATLGLAMAQTGVLYPFFGTLLGWLGVALTGSDTASNALFGGLQKVTSEQLGLSPVLMGAANSSGGVMGKMIDAQSIVVASTATNMYGEESKILRAVFFHSIALACLVGLLVTAQARVPWVHKVLVEPALNIHAHP